MLNAIHYREKSVWKDKEKIGTSKMV